MKKRRVILSILLALVLLLSVAIAVACTDNDDPNRGDNPGGNETPGGNEQPTVSESWMLQGITIGGTYKTEYQLNEAFAKDGLTVSATMKGITTGNTRTDNVTAQAVVDSSRFNSAMVGTYVITISYTHANVTRYAHYSVSVAPYEPVINGISMTKTTVDYNIPEGQSTVSINIDDITVKAIDENGKEAETPLAADAYTLTYYNGGQKVDNLTAATKGSYTIQAERKSDGQKAFVVVYVLDPAVSIAFKSGTVTQGQALTDNMTADWVFTVTNRSGTTCEVTSDNVEVSGVITLIPSTYSASVSYNEYDGKGQLASADGIVTSVEYSITRVDGMVNQSYAVNMSSLADTSEVKDTRALSEAAGIYAVGADGSSITFDSNSKSIDGKQFTKRLKLNGTAKTTSRFVKIDIKSTSMITVYAASGSDGTARVLALYKGSVAAANRVDNNDGIKGITKLTFIIDEKDKGTYCLGSMSSGINIYYIQVDTVYNGASAEGKENVNLPTETEVSGITINTNNVKKDFIKGDTFTWDGLVVSKTIYNRVTADAASVEVTEGYTVTVPDGSMTEQGKPTVTVAYQGKTATYTINVNSLVDGVNGIKVTLPATTIELDKAGGTITLSESDVTVTTDSGAAIVMGAEAGQCANLTIELYSVGETETKLDSLTVGAGKYKVKVIATYNNTVNDATTDFTAEISFTVKFSGGDTPSQHHSYMVSANDLADGEITEEIAWLEADEDGNGVSITAASGKTVVIDANKKSMDGNSFTKRVKLGGEGSAEARSIKITVTEKTTITIYAMSSSSSAARAVQLLDQVGSAVNLVGNATLDGTAFTADTTVEGSSLHKIVITVEAGTYYFCSKASGLNVYGVNLEIGQA